MERLLYEVDEVLRRVARVRTETALFPYLFNVTDSALASCRRAKHVIPLFV